MKALAEFIESASVKEKISKEKITGIIRVYKLVFLCFDLKKDKEAN